MSGIGKCQIDGRPVWQATATELSAAFAAGSTTPIEALASTLDRLDEVNPSINAVVTLDIPGAREAAAASTARWRSGDAHGPLDGIAITIKDNILVRGMRATWGSRLYEDFIPDTDEEPVARLRACGAVIIGKTNVPEFTLQGYTSNAIFGVTRNPWDLSKTPGGSSGGAVGAVASGIGPLALATDGGGSIRRPAAHTGLVGFKPSRGAVGRAHGFPVILHDFEVAGTIARCVGDIVLAMRVIGDGRWDIEDARRPMRARRILFAPTLGTAPVDRVIAAAVGDVARILSSAGHQVTTTTAFDLARPIDDVWPVISQAGLAWLIDTHPLGREVAERRAGGDLVEMADRGRGFSAADYIGALQIRADVAKRFDALLDDHAFLLMPTTAAMPWQAEVVYPETIDARPVGPRGHAVFTPFANALGLPAISLPCPVADGAMPIGYQLVAARGRDTDLLAMADAAMDLLRPRMQWPLLA